MTGDERQRQRDEREQLLTLVNGWDPAGLLQQGVPRDLYAPLADKLFDVVSSDPSEDELSALLESEVREQFDAEAVDAGHFAAKVLTWSRLRTQDR